MYSDHLQRQKQQTARHYIGQSKAARFCAPTCFYALGKAYGYISDNFQQFCKKLDWDQAYAPGRGWIRAKLSNWLRQNYGMAVVSWVIGQDAEIKAMVKAGYLKTDREIEFFKSEVQSTTVKDLAQHQPIVITAKPGFATTQSVHAVIIKSWKEGQVEIVDPDERNQRSFYDEVYIEEFLTVPGSACSLLLPPQD